MQMSQHKRMRLERLKAALEENNFDVYIANTKDEARNLILHTLLPRKNPKSVSWGGSITLDVLGIPEELKNDENIAAVIPSEFQNRRKALSVDLFFTGCNAITEDGQLVNLDSIGNRIAALTFGPKEVIVVAGRNKVVKNITHAMTRVKEYTAPLNAMRLGFKTPCAKTGFCTDCRGSSRICNYWSIIEKSSPKGRISVILINEDLGI
jgi:L-lactate utilization protein LutB